MNTDEWTRARLVPIASGNSRTLERHSTSVLLSVLTVVREFSQAVLEPLGASGAASATVEAFTEVPIKTKDGVIRPDGVIAVTSRGRTWTALVEAKVGSSELGADQIQKYISAARDLKADAVITISNEIGVAGAHPTSEAVPRSNSKVQLHHISWSRLVAEALRCRNHSGVEDLEQAWILNEFLRFLEHPDTGVTSSVSMGSDWGGLLTGAKGNSLHRNTKGLASVAAKWDEIVTRSTLRLMTQTGADVEQILSPRSMTPDERHQSVISRLAETGEMEASIRVPNTAGDMNVVTNLGGLCTTVSMEVAAPHGRATNRGKVSWLVNQLGAAPGKLRIDAYASRARTPVSASLDACRDSSTVLSDQSSDDIVRFVVALQSDTSGAKTKRGKKRSFAESVLQSVDAFYETVAQPVAPWVEKAPKMQRKTDVAVAELPLSEMPVGSSS